MVTSGPLLPLWPAGGREARYLCVACADLPWTTEQFVMFGPGDTPPRTLRLPCFGAALDQRTGLEHVPMHLYVLAELAAPPGAGQGVGSQGGDEGAPGTGAQRP
jgi:hypothetical protein